MDIVGSETTSTKAMTCVHCAKPMDSPICCTSCGALNPLPPDALDYFELFGIEQGYDIDERALHRKYLSLSRPVHPDIVGGESQEIRARSLSLSAELNRAYETLRDPVGRAEYLLVRAGGPTAADDRSVPGELLAEVMTLREEIEEANQAGDTARLQAMRQQLAARRQTALKTITQLCRSLGEANSQTRKNLRQQLNAIKYWDNLLEQLPAGEPA